ncbi:MAG: heavy-metal-associated domain-containing protein [Gammaproteobacteria bacterium]|nr:heavy-metal-associated domain-containing protein [Gammaproteobacteria bacterium]
MSRLIMNSRYKVKSMKCNGCVSTVQNALEQPGGSESVSIDLGTAIAEIGGNIDSDEGIEVLTDLGYPASKQD